LTELSRGNQDSGFIGFYNFCYVLDNAGTVIYNNKKYSLAADLLPNYFIIDPQITTLPLSIFSF